MIIIQKDAQTDVAGALQQSNNTNIGSSGNNSNNSGNGNQQSTTVVDATGQSVTLGINGSLNKK